MTRGFYIGRFQPFHDGHREMTDRIAEAVDEVVVGIGSADASHTVRNPFTAGERIMMVSRVLEDIDTRTYVVPIEDIDRNSVWVSHIRSMAPAFDVAYSNNPLVIRLFQEAGIEVRQSEMYNREDLKGSRIRSRMIDGKDWNHLVPDAVVDVIDEVDGLERLRQVAGDDGGDATENDN
ncbi:nicotinamide-nucleotide adenylyltransferase [Halorientalis sp. IM1011]|uniref:nicotinamide-nucleotide adenylyltransferase n=1 Tax=Halorientalis sp. IM1011 TaxID=1932360 RepID=UPI00097CCB99|nr:nicotinamide-nucleotide adenylyltransferase [Halorientalis sp. IM1011]AQL42038.1 nicotinamide-nucleotide adenylyltransferase [Halorientalis sp. IM1011]